MVKNPSAVWQLDKFTWVIDVVQGGRCRTFQVAGLGARVLAALYDQLLKAVIQGSVVWYLLFEGKTITHKAVLAAAAVVFIEIFYSFVFEWTTKGQTAGKNVCGIRVVSWDGSPAAPGQLLVRSVMRLVDWLPLFYFAGFVRAWKDPLSLRWGDCVARTLVTYALPLRERLMHSGIGEAAYSTTPDAFLLESFYLRQNLVPQSLRDVMAEHLAKYFFERYPCDDPVVEGAYRAGEFVRFLNMLYQRETGDASRTPIASSDAGVNSRDRSA